MKISRPLRTANALAFACIVACAMTQARAQSSCNLESPQFCEGDYGCYGNGHVTNRDAEGSTGYFSYFALYGTTTGDLNTNVQLYISQTPSYPVDDYFTLVSGTNQGGAYSAGTADDEVPGHLEFLSVNGYSDCAGNTSGNFGAEGITIRFNVSAGTYFFG